jgi:hypothetical protein
VRGDVRRAPSSCVVGVWLHGNDQGGRGHGDSRQGSAALSHEPS